MRPLRRGLFLAALVAATACGKGAQSEPAIPLRSLVPLVVSNNSAFDVSIYVFRGNTSKALGIVPPGADMTLQIPGDFVADGSNIRVRAIGIGTNQQFFSPAQNLRPDEALQLIVNQRLTQSQLILIGKP